MQRSLSLFQHSRLQVPVSQPNSRQQMGTVDTVGSRLVFVMPNFTFYPAPAAFAGLMYLFVRQKYFVGYLGERTQR